VKIGRENPVLTGKRALNSFSPDVRKNSKSGSAGRRRTGRRRWRLSKVKYNLDKNPRLEAVVGFFIDPRL